MSATVVEQTLTGQPPESERLAPFDALFFLFISTLVALTGVATGYQVPNVLFVLTVIYAVFAYFQGIFRPRLHPIVIGLSIVLIGSLLPVLTGNAVLMADATEHVRRSAAIVLMVFLVAGYLSSHKRLDLLLLASLTGFIVAFVVGHLILRKTAGDRYIALYVNPNSAAFWSMFTFINAYLFAKMDVPSRVLRSARLRRIVVATAMLSSVWLMWASQSRKTFLAILFPLAYIVFNLIRRSRHRVVVTFLLAVVIIGSATALWRTMPETDKRRLENAVTALSTGEAREGGLKKRVEYYAIGYDLIRDHPLIGLGGGAFISEGIHLSTTMTVPSDTHSVYLDVIIESGLLGILAYLLMFVYLLFYPLSAGRGKSEPYFIFFSILSILMIQAGGSIQLDKYMWVTLAFMYAWFSTAPSSGTVQTTKGP